MEEQKIQEKYMKEAIRQAKKAGEAGDVPIGCVIVYEGKIIARGYNKRNQQKSALGHAEISAIRKASKKLGDWRLEECTMYVTLEPCPMCAGAIVQARIPEVVVGAMNPKAGCAGSIINLLQMQQLNHQVRLQTGILEEDCQKAGVQMMLNTTATEILTDDNGAAVGIKATGASGETITINAKAVILTSGGFGANMDMVVEYKPELKGFMTTNAPGILGQGIKMAQAIGADTVDMDQIQIHPTVEANTAALITEGLRGDGAILINEEGQRFIDEVGTRDVVSAAEIAQTGSYSWLVVDQAMVDASSVIQGYIKKGYTVTGETYEELGKAMGVDEAAFAETMNTWNGYVEAKNDPDFGRTSFADKLDTAPYYAIKVTAGVHHTMGGLKINTNTEVLNENGEIIPGLFAAGEVTGGVHGANRLGGNAVADFTVFGRIAGAAASDYAA